MHVYCIKWHGDSSEIAVGIESFIWMVLLSIRCGIVSLLFSPSLSLSLSSTLPFSLAGGIISSDPYFAFIFQRFFFLYFGAEWVLFTQYVEHMLSWLGQSLNAPGFHHIFLLIPTKIPWIYELKIKCIVYAYVLETFANSKTMQNYAGIYNFRHTKKWYAFSCSCLCLLR